MKARLLLLCVSLAAALPASAENLRLTVLHTNDMHGWVMPRPDRKEPQRLVGGAATLVNAVRKFREEDKAVLVVDTGDWYQGTPEGTLTGGRSLVDLMNAVGYDAVLPGNHDYDMGEAALRGLLANLRPQVLASNIYGAKTGRPVDYLRPYLVREVGGLRVGVFGLETTHMKALSFEKNIAGLEFRDEVETAKATVAALRAAGADIVIALSHLGFEDPSRPPFVGDQTLAAKVPGIDLIVGGHSHTTLYEGAVTSGTLIVQSGPNLVNLGRVVFELDPETRKVVSKKAEVVKLWVDQFGQDEDMARTVKRYEEEVGRTLDVVIATSAAFMGRERQAESAVGNWVADCARDWTGVQVAFQNGGGIRADMPAGPVKLRHIFEIMPFDNYVTTLSLTGAQVRSILERGVSGSVGMLQVSGLRLVFDRAAPVGKRVSEVFVGEAPLRDEAEYTVAAPDFIVQGGDDFAAFAEGRGKAVTPTLLRDALAWCAKRASPIVAKPLGRIVER